MRCFARSLHFIHYLCLQNVKVNLDQTHEKYPVYRFIYRNTIFNRISYLTRIQILCKIDYITHSSSTPYILTILYTTTHHFINFNTHPTHIYSPNTCSSINLKFLSLLSHLIFLRILSIVPSSLTLFRIIIRQHSNL